MKLLQLTTAVGGILLAGLGGVMAATNPGPKAYEQFATDRLTGYVRDRVCHEITGELGKFLDRQCNSLIAAGMPQFRAAISQNTRRQNFLLLSIYQTDLSLPSSLPDYHFETIGLFGKFHIYQSRRQ